MRPADVILLNAREVRRRSEIAWRGIPPDSLQWKPDPQARSAIEMVRHVLEGEYLYMQIARERRGRSLRSATRLSPYNGSRQAKGLGLIGQ